MPSSKKIKKIDIVPAKRGRKPKVQQSAPEKQKQEAKFTTQDHQSIRELIEKVLKLRKIVNRKQLYEDMVAIRFYVKENLKYGPTNFQGLIGDDFLDQMICKSI